MESTGQTQPVTRQLVVNRSCALKKTTPGTTSTTKEITIPFMGI